jgi:hypothetical protein
MQTSQDLVNKPRPTSPIKDQRGPALFMMFLLIISGLTASIVGYRVKSADIDRKTQLLAAYKGLGGSFERANSLGTTLFSESLTAEQSVFIVAYEINSRARMHGLYRVLETTPTPVMQVAIKSLYTIDAKEAARSTEDAWTAFQEPVSSTADIKNMNPKAARFARQYDRYLARDAEVKLFRYLHDHPNSIQPQK